MKTIIRGRVLSFAVFFVLYVIYVYVSEPLAVGAGVVIVLFVLVRFFWGLFVGWGE